MSYQDKQLRLDLFSSKLEKSLNPSNRWYILENLLPWDQIERIYNKSLQNKNCGSGNKSARMVIGALIIKHKMNLSDKETIQIILDNPYIQYLIGLEDFTSEPAFTSSLFFYIRKRIDIESFNEITLSVVSQAMSNIDSQTKDDNDTSTEKEVTDSDEESFIDEDGNLHKGSI